MLDEPQQLRRQRGLGDGIRPRAPDPGGQLDDVVVGQAGERAPVAHVDHLDVAGVPGQRGDELSGGLAVERAAALLEQRRLLAQRRIGVQVEELTLDLGHRCARGVSVRCSRTTSRSA